MHLQDQPRHGIKSAAEHLQETTCSQSKGFDIDHKNFRIQMKGKKSHAQ